MSEDKAYVELWMIGWYSRHSQTREGERRKGVCHESEERGEVVQRLSGMTIKEIRGSV